MNILPTQTTTTWANGKTSQVTMSYDSGFTFPNPTGSGAGYTGLYGKVITQKEYDYGTSSGVPGPLLRQTNTSYVWQSPNPHFSNYLSNNMLNLVYSSQITDGTSQKAFTQYGYDETATIASGMSAAQNLDTAPWTGLYRGNRTSVNRWRNLPSVQTLTSTTTYYDTGMPSVAKDPLLNPTTYQYSSTFQGAYATQIKNALNQSSYPNYDYNTGLLISTTDPNGQITTNSYDVVSRLTNVSRPAGGGQTSFCYTDLGGSTCSQGSAPYQVVITKAITSTVNETATAIVDGMGRLAHTQLNSDPEGVVYADDTYDAAGNKSTTTNPYRTTSDTTYGITTNAYDALHRGTQVTQADGSLLKTAYCGNSTLVTDEAGHWRRSIVDGLGRLIEVDEPNSTTATVNANGCPGTSEPIWVTTYGYDTLGNLIGVLQAGSRARSFSYDSLSRILTADNPESGHLAYTYDADGDVTTKTTPLQNQTNPATTTAISYCYDSLNRLTAKGYGVQACTAGTMSTPVATYTYDGSGCLGQASCYNIGHRTGMTDPAGSESWAYDQVGRTVVQSRTTATKTKTTNYTYNLDSSVATLTYPSGRIITYTPDTAGRLSNAKDNTTSVYYATGTCANGILGNGACYAPQGATALLQNGTSLVSTHIYNKRLQPCWMYSTTGTALATSRLCTDTATTANMLDLKYNFNLGTDNGNPVSIANNRVSGRGQTFAYDQLNRVSTAQTTGSHASDPTLCWGQAFGYDSTGNWSNLLSIAGSSSAYTGCTQGSLSVSVTTKNQISTDTYDAAGNLMTIPGTGGATYVFNTENQMTSTSNSSTQYIYDGDGNRVEKSGSKIYWYAGSEVLDETDLTGSVTNGSFNEYVFFGGNRIARRDSSNNVFYYLADQLGTSRAIVQGGQTVFCYDADFEPFGGEHAYTNTCAQNYKFTGKERDSESGLDYLGARYYGSGMARFNSADPKSITKQRVRDPQQWNMYSYTRNNPLAFVDPDGREVRTPLQGQQYDQLVKMIAKEYMKESFRKDFNKLSDSKTVHEIGNKDLRSKDSQVPGTPIWHTVLGTNDPKIETNKDGKADLKKNTISFDLTRLGGDYKDDQSAVTRHEIHHGVQIEDSPEDAKQYQHGDKAVQDRMENDAASVENSGKEPNSMTEEDAEKEVQEKLIQDNPSPK
ncbi:MAG: RHS repeat-associated core domain-containing protein [Acidobacteria bacterium]|nr:RHS repeat-associated core domain-containing protein [Acidobacteriota bacterium]